MGSYYLTANITKRQFVDPFCFGENARTSGFTMGFHFVGVAMLACDVRALIDDPLPGSWAGDEIVVVRDESVASQGYEDISYRVIAMLARTRSDFVATMVERAAGSVALRHVGNAVMLVGSPELEAALVARLGKGWVKKYQAALESGG